MKKSINILSISLSGILLFILFQTKMNSFQDNPNDSLSFRDSVNILNFTFVGDLMCSSVQYSYAEVDSGYDFTENYQIIKPFLNKADFTVGNLETVFAGKKKGYSGYPTFNTPDEYLYALKDAGFDMLLTANNHSLDKGKKGLLRTIEKIDEAGLFHTGTFTSQEERDSLQIIEINGISFAVFSYSYGTNGIPVPEGEDYLVNLIDYPPIESDIEKAKQAKVDLIIVYYHFGDEYDNEPSYLQENLVKETIGFGADIIIGSHPHVPQPIEFFKTNNANLDSGFVAYSLGNFISNQRWRYSDGGPILNFQIVKDNLSDSIYVNEISVVPTWVFKGKNNGELDYIILPSDSTKVSANYKFMTGKDKSLFVQSYKDIIEIMSSRSNKIKFYSPSFELKKYLSSTSLIFN